VETPDVHWEDVGGLSSLKERLIEAVEWPLKYARLFEQAKVKPPKGILLSGPPGCGQDPAGQGHRRRESGQFHIGQGTGVAF